jgi:sterol desaturase/sphingolipid hydroxylase (fatty acid hydroxylase superfamily)
MFLFISAAVFLYNLIQIARWWVWFRGKDEQPVTRLKTAATHFFHLTMSLGIFKTFMLFTTFPPYTWFFPLRVAAVYIMTEIWFYFSHRLMHHPRFYKFHKDHHVYKEPPPHATFYCSTTEHLVVNMGTLIVPMIIIPLPYYFTLVWSFLVMNNAVSAHMGTEYIDYEHYIHHQKFTKNFGAGTWVDKLLGTWSG